MIYRLLFAFLLTFSSAYAMRTNELKEDVSSSSSPSSYRLNASSSKQKEVWVLSIDGGRMSGIIPAYILSQLEEKLASLVRQGVQRKIEKSLGAPLDPSMKIPVDIHLAQAFDLMAGGGLLTLGLNVPTKNGPKAPLYKAKTFLDLYQNRGPEIFPVENKKGLMGSLTRNKFDPKGLEEIFLRYFEDASLKEALTSLMILRTASYSYDWRFSAASHYPTPVL